MYQWDETQELYSFDQAVYETSRLWLSSNHRAVMLDNDMYVKRPENNKMKPMKPQKAEKTFGGQDIDCKYPYHHQM